MTDKTEKIKKSKNFTSDEEHELLDLVRKYQDIVECKKTDHMNNLKKTECWKKIEDEFNSYNKNSFRSCGALRTKYENLKRRSKEKLAEKKQILYGTGGGPSLSVELTPAELEASSIVGGKRSSGQESEFDGDSVWNNFVVNTNSDEEDEVQPLSEVEDQNSNKNNWAKYTPQLLREPMDPKLRSKKLETPNQKENTPPENTALTPSGKRRKKCEDKLSARASSKAALNVLQEEQYTRQCNLKNECFLKEHQLKLEAESRIHALREQDIQNRMKMSREKHEAEMEMAREKHEAKMEILRLQKQKLLK